MKIKNKNTQISLSLSLSSFLFPNLSLSQLSFSLSKSFSEIFSLFLLKINNIAILFLVLFSSKKKNLTKKVITLLFCLVAEKIKEKSLENQKENPQKKPHLLYVVFGSRENEKKKKNSLKNKPFSPPQRNPRKPNHTI